MRELTDDVPKHQPGSHPLLWSFFGPITGEKMLSSSLSFKFKYRKGLSVLFHVLLAKMRKSPTEAHIDVSTEALCTYKQPPCQGTE